MFSLRADKSDESDSLIVNFHSKWKEHLDSGDIVVFFRKFGPKHFVPQHVYTYIAAPVSAITARLEISKYERMPVDDALELSERGKLSAEELRSYAVNFNNLVVFTVGATYIAEKPISLEHLSRRYFFWPDSTSIPLTKEGAEIIEQEGQFKPLLNKQKGE